MSSLEVKPHSLSIKCQVPTSKSYANRLLILAALKDGPFTIINLPPSSDVATMISCLKKIGLKITKEKTKETSEECNSICIHNSFPSCEEGLSKEILEIETGDGGTTNRFLLALLALGSRPYLMKLKGDMRTRPMKEMEQVITKLQCQIKNDNGDIFIQGPIKYSGEVTVDCSQSTQFLTAFKLIESYCSGLIFIAENLNTSQAYYELTLDLISKTKAQSKYTVPPDYSSLGYLLAAGLTLGNVHVENCTDKDVYQADSVFLDLIKEMDGDLSLSDSGLHLQAGSKLKPIDVDCGGFPDLVPTLAYVCSYCDGKSILRNLKVLTYKESNRFEEIKKLLSLFEVKYFTQGFDLIIEGSQDSCQAKEYHPKPDHRMVMVGYLFMRKNNGGILHEVEHVGKSYSSFFEQFA